MHERFIRSVYSAFCTLNESLGHCVSDSVCRAGTALFCLESGFGNSRLAVEQHNYCGMRVPRRRPHLGSAAGSFLVYESLDECVADFFHWIGYHHRDMRQCSVDEFLSCLRAWRYCPDRLYTDRVKAVLTKVDSVLL